MSSNEFRHAAEQEAPDAASPMRTNDDQIGTPLRCGIDDTFSDITNFDRGIYLESCVPQLVRNSLDQLMRWFLLIVQFGSISWRHLRRSRRTRLQHMQDPSFCVLGPKLHSDSP